MKSYVKYLNEIESEYHNKLKHAKKPSNVIDIFAQTVLNLLKKIYGENAIDLSDIGDIIFDEELEEGYKLMGKLKRITEEDMNKSDLPAILKKLAKEAKDRYIHIIKDQDRTETFRLSPSSNRR